MRLDLYTGERERFLNIDCFCFTATNSTSAPIILEYSNCCPIDFDATISLPANDSVKIFGETDFFNPPSGVTINIDEASDTCNECFRYTYKLYNCIDDSVVYTNYINCPDCIQYINELVFTNLDPNPCWYVTVTDDVVNTFTSVTISDATCTPCQSKCYTITGTGNVSYIRSVDGEYVLDQSETAPVKVCSFSYPSVSGDNYQIFIGEECYGNTECPTTCYELTNCDTNEIIYSYNQDLAFPYELNETVKLTEFTGCWTIATVTCNEDLPFVSTTVTQTYTSCTECNPPNYYKLESCGSSDPLTVYTSQDLSAYTGKTVTMEEHPGCYYVTVFPTTFPSPSVVTIISSFNSCPECEAQRYVLSDCDEIRPNIYTTTNLAAYVGQIIKLTFYPDTCWSVAETTVNTSDDLVIVGDTYTTCLECALTSPCICTTITNNSTTTQVFGYNDCDNVYENITLAAGEQSVKQCVLKWIFPSNWTLPKIITNYGDCVDSQCVVPKPFRSVRPGYNSPSCTTDYYERIACSYAEMLYKDVIAQRYGIAPCCPEEESFRLDIKFQLLELQAINNPDYLCAPTSDCCSKDNDCGCGCNS